MATEIEMKLQIADEHSWIKLMEYLGSMKACESHGKIQMTADYYDTDDKTMSNKLIAYRIRRENSELVATIKGGGKVEKGMHRRFECNVIVDSDKPDLSVFMGSEAACMVQEFLHKPLVKMVRTEFVRDVFYVKQEQTEIEIAMDRGRIVSRGQSVPILELELELKQGSEMVIREFAGVLQSQAVLKPTAESKLTRGLKLWRIGGA